MRPLQRFMSNMKDAVAYFGFRQVFRQLMGKAAPSSGSSSASSRTPSA
jgi:hypothetical protein